MMKIEKGNNNQTKHNRGYSILEMVITLLIANVIILMLSNILVISLKLSAKTQQQSNAREEITNIANQIKRDIRNANKILTTAEAKIVFPSLTGENCQGGTCVLSAAGKVITWQMRGGNCGVASTPCNRIYRYEGTTTQNTTFTSADNINFTEFKFENAGDEIVSRDQASFLVTIKGDHIDKQLDIPQLFRQVAISTRNYKLKTVQSIAEEFPAGPIIILANTATMLSGTVGDSATYGDLNADHDPDGNNTDSEDEWTLIGTDRATNWAGNTLIFNVPLEPDKIGTYHIAITAKNKTNRLPNTDIYPNFTIETTINGDVSNVNILASTEYKTTTITKTLSEVNTISLKWINDIYISTIPDMDTKCQIPSLSCGSDIQIKGIVLTKVE